jgi:hypothetical protein
VWIEIVLVHVEWCRYFTTLIQLTFLEHSLAVEVVDDVTSLGVNKVTTLVGILSAIIFELGVLVHICTTFSVLVQSNDVTFLVPVEITNDITFIKFA